MGKTRKKPDVLFILTDDQRFDTINALGNRDIITPNMDSLVKNGVSFTHSYIQGGTTGAVCMPSRAMIHTGRSLFRIKDAGLSIPKSHTLMGTVFQKAGYRVFGTGKWHNGKDSYARSFSDGAEIFFGGMSDHWNVPVYDFDPTGKYETKLPFCPDAYHSNEINCRDCTHITAGKHSSELLCDAAIDFIKKDRKDKPLFIYLSSLAPHDPRTMPEKYRKMYSPDKMSLPTNFTGGHPFDLGEDMWGRDELLAGFPRTPREIKRHIAEYYAMITHLDSQIGRVIKTLKETGRFENTIIILTGDNGLALGQHGLMGKQNMYEHSIHVPLVMCGPGIPKNGKRDSFVYLFDIFPTLCELVGVSIPKSVDGASFVPTLKNPTYKIRRDMFFAFRQYFRAVRQERFKLIEYNVNGERTTQLFDLKDDPFETNNLASEKSQKNRVSKLRSLMIRLKGKYADSDKRWGKIFWDGWK
jgi:arylsulfatase A-like enzyme